MDFHHFDTLEEAEKSYHIVRSMLWAERKKHKEVIKRKEAKIVYLIHKLRELNPLKENEPK